MSNILSFNFESETIRIKIINGNPWFVAIDVCRSINIKNTSDAISVLDDDEVALDLTEGSHRPTNFISEAGVYTLVLRSRNAVKKGTIQYKFRKWVTNEVLPQIRRTGSYVHPSHYAVECITSSQYQELRHVVWSIGHAFHHANGGEWAAWQVLRKKMCVSNAQKIPAHQFAECMVLLKGIEKKCTAFRHEVMDVEKQFMRSHFGNPPSLAQLEQACLPVSDPETYNSATDHPLPRRYLHEGRLR